MVRHALLLQADETDPETGGAPPSSRVPCAAAADGLDGDGAKEAEAQLLEIEASDACCFLPCLSSWVWGSRDMR